MSDTSRSTLDVTSPPDDSRLPSREHLLASALIEIADNLVADFDVVELLTVLADRCVEIFGVAAAGLMLAQTPGGRLQALASSSEAIRILELFEEQSEEGPCPDCYRSGEPVVNRNLAGAADLWPNFTPRALAAGFDSVHALPMRLRGATIGALNLFCADAHQMEEADVAAAQALADVATIAILQNRRIAESLVLNRQLQGALKSRIVIEQAKGIVAERSHCSMESAFAHLRSYARMRNLRLADVASGTVDGTIEVGMVAPIEEHRSGD